MPLWIYSIATAIVARDEGRSRTEGKIITATRHATPDRQRSSTPTSARSRTKTWAARQAWNEGEEEEQAGN